MQSVIIKSGMEQFLVLMEYLSNGCHVVVRANLLAGASLGFEQELQLNSATVSLTIKLWLLLCWGVSLDGHWQVFLATVNSCEHFLFWIPNRGDLWWIHVLCGEPEGKKKRGKKEKKKKLGEKQLCWELFLEYWVGCKTSWAHVSWIQAIGHVWEPSWAALRRHPHLLSRCLCCSRGNR